jgi:hypothetical protein
LDHIQLVDDAPHTVQIPRAAARLLSCQA